MRAGVSLFDQINERLLRLLDDLDVIVYVIDLETYEILFINQRGTALWGDALGRKCWESLRKNLTGPCSGCNNQKVLASDDQGFYKRTFYDAGNNKWLDSRGHIIDWLGGRRAKLGIALDITEQKALEAALQNKEMRLQMSEEALLESEQMFASIVNNAPSIIFTMTLDGYYSFVSSSCSEFLGYQSTQIEGRHYRDYIHPQDLPIYEYFLEKLAAEPERSTETKLPYRIKHQDGSWHWHRSSGSVIEDKDKKVLFYIGVASDITQQVEYEDKLLKSNQELEAALEEIISIEEELRIQYDHLEKQGQELRDSKQVMEDIIGFLPDATLVIDREGRTLFWNKAMEKLTGIEATEMIGKGDYEYSLILEGRRQPMLIDLVLEDEPLIAKQYKRVKASAEKILMIEDFHLKNYPESYFSVKAAPLYNARGELIGAMQSYRDVTSRRTAENKLRYFAEHDTMTGLLNRSCFEKEIKKSDNTSGKMVALIMSDVDGLKLVNDTLGHQEGDKLLITSAEILREACPQNSSISRIGGDEFCIILRNTTEEELAVTLRKINKAIEEYNVNKPVIPLSISHGLAYSCAPQVNMLTMFKEAEEKMYYEKLLHSQSARSKIVDVMMKALEARDFITEGHADRLCEITERIAEYIGMPEHRINSLRIFARFHDIGKVGISDTILFKPGRLTKKEFQEMQKHSEIGFRIAQSTPDLAHISDWILKHHEWWNGNGYPFGLAGEEIPLECRILAVADAFDSMCNDRPYRKALKLAACVQELKRNSGIQFDPAVVDVFLDILAKGHDFAGK